MFEIIWNSIAENVFEIIASAISIIVAYYVVPAIKDELIPWLKDKRLYSLIQRLVQAAEKMAESGIIPRVDKKKTVIDWLQKKGIPITDEVDAFIESAVKDLDIITGTLMEGVLVEGESEVVIDDKAADVIAEAVVAAVAENMADAVNNAVEPVCMEVKE